MTTNLHNAIVHNLPTEGSVWVKAGARFGTVVLTVENTGEELSADLVPTLTEPFRRRSERMRGADAGVGLGLAIVKSIVPTTGPSPSHRGRAAGFTPPCSSPPAAVTSGYLPDIV